MHVWNVLHADRWKYRTQKLPSGHHRTTLSSYMLATKTCIDNRKKNLLNSSISSTCSHNMTNFGPLAAEICWRTWGTPANLNRFRILASLLQRSRSIEVNQTLHDVWPSPGLVHYIYIFEGSCPLTEFCQVQDSLCIQVSHSAILACYWMALEQRSSAKLCDVVQGMELENFRRGATYTRLGGHHVGHRPTF